LRKLVGLLNTSSGDFIAKSISDRQQTAGLPRALWPQLVELWMFAVLAGFFLLRVFGSHTAQRVLNGIRHSQFP
jgi:hypothetical protein